MFELTRRVVVIIGATGNLGRAAAERFRGAGARTVLVDRRSDRLPRAFPEHDRSSDHLLIGGVDLAEADSVSAMARQVNDRFGRIDALLHTVGGFAAGKPVHEEDVGVWDRMMTVNLRTALMSSRAVVPHMLRQGSGCIVFTAARPAFRSGAGFAPYAASKSAVLRLGESLSEELKSSGIRVNCLVPAIIDTPQNRQAMPDADHDTWVEPEAIADVAVFLVSDAARAITGAAIPVYGRG